MKASELRIGNWIEVKCIAKECGGDGFDPQPCNLQNLISISNGNEDFLFRPIPITEEWLVKFGGERYLVEGYPMYFINPFNIEYYEEECIVYYSDNSNTVIKYIHQLQNLYFSLTGVELKSL